MDVTSSNKKAEKQSALSLIIILTVLGKKKFSEDQGEANDQDKKYKSLKLKE